MNHVPDVVTESLRKSDDRITFIVTAITVVLAIVSLFIVPDVGAR